MKTSFFREITLYRYRYIIGYLVFGLLLLALLLLGIEHAPRGLSQAEMDSTVTSVRINMFHPITTNVIDAPYHLLQKLSVHFLGLTPIAIKLPSILLGVITGICIILMLQKWFRRNVAIVTALIIVTSVGFLGLARTGTPMIMTVFWTVVLLLGATYVLHAQHHRFLWKLFCFVAVALLAYSPFGIYPLLAMAIAGIFHPHVRHRLRQGTWRQHVTLVVTMLIVLTPLAIATVSTPAIGLELLGIASTGDLRPPALLASALQAGHNLFDFTNSQTGAIVTPLFDIATIILLTLGLLKLFTASYSARSYMLFVWLLLLIPVFVLRPDMVGLIIVPATLILAIGIETLIRQWYDLFPRNPYARITALVPLSILLISIVNINIERYFYGHHYTAPSVVMHAELSPVRTELATNKLGKTAPATLGVPAHQTGFYDLLRREYPKLTIVSDPTQARTPLIVLASATPQLAGQTPTKIVTNDLSQDNVAVLLRVYLH